MPLIDLVDETFVVAEPAAVAERLRDAQLWREWWPGRELVVFMDRGEAGVRWTVTGDLVGSCEVWLEPSGDGAIVHYFLRADPTRRGSRTEPMTGRPRRQARRAARVLAGQAMRWKAFVNAIKDELESGRPVGTARNRTIAPEQGGTSTTDRPSRMSADLPTPDP
jgi:hypothetical protein